MHSVIIIGDGPGGLSAALFLAKNQQDVVVFGDDKSAMHYAYLRNYLGIPEIHGSELQRIGREQAIHVGARIREERVREVAAGGDRFTVTLESGEQVAARYLILSEGKGPKLAKQLGLEFDEQKGIAADRNARTSVERVYVVGRSARPGRSQAIISAGDGAAAAIDILSREQGKDVLDWDEPPQT
jgi:thioredoxin reductase (NADPH)